MTEYTVTCSKKCNRCNGEGMIINPVHENMETHVRKWTKKNSPVLLADQKTVADEWFRKHHFDCDNKWPPARIICRKCSGDGILITEVSLEEALQDMHRIRAEA